MDTEKIIDMKPKKDFKVGGLFTGILLLVIIIILAVNSFVIVQAGHRGVLLQLGAVKEGTLEEGMHFKIPFIQTGTVLPKYLI